MEFWPTVTKIVFVHKNEQFNIYACPLSNKKKTFRLALNNEEYTHYRILVKLGGIPYKLFAQSYSLWHTALLLCTGWEDNRFLFAGQKKSSFVHCSILKNRVLGVN